jgi:hypothetical protein
MKSAICALISQKLLLPISSFYHELTSEKSENLKTMSLMVNYLSSYPTEVGI